MPSEILTMYKCTRPDGTDFRTGTIDYAKALIDGVSLEIDAESATGRVCGHGLHVSPTAKQTIQFADKKMRPWRWFEVAVKAPDVVESDEEKSRVRALRVQREVGLSDIFGDDFANRIAAARDEFATWEKIPWFNPPREVSDAELKKLFREWHSAISQWTRGDAKLPKKVKIVREFAAADAAADAAAAAADAAAADAADDAAAAAAAAAADAAAADAAAAAADADADAAAAAADADAAADAARFFYRYRRWYIRPYYVLRRSSRWKLAGMSQSSPWNPLIEMFKLGCIPIGYSGGVFVIYAPKPQGVSK